MGRRKELNDLLEQIRNQMMNQGAELSRLMRGKKMRDEELRKEREERMDIERVLVAIRDAGVTPSLAPALAQALMSVGQMSDKMAVPAQPVQRANPSRDPDVEML